MTEDITQLNSKDRLDAYMQQARVNESKLRQFQDMELKLLSAESLADLCAVLINDYRLAFALDQVKLVLIDSGRQLQDLLDEKKADEAYPDIVKNVQLVTDYPTLQRLSKLPNTPVLTSHSKDEHQQFFNDEETDLGSVAILPLHRHNLLLGFLCLGSKDAARYEQDMATDFLERLSAMAAVSIENAINIESLRQLGLRDTLTTAYNRRYFFQRLNEEINRALRQSLSVGCLYLDLDFFKQINDHYGHAAGDAVLIHTTQLISKCIRNSDVLARIGGEEFAVILPQIDNDGMIDIAERIRNSIADNDCELTTHTKIKTTVSIGMDIMDFDHMVGEPSELGDILVNQADEALLHVKKNGRNHSCAYADIKSDKPDDAS